MRRSSNIIGDFLTITCWAGLFFAWAFSFVTHRDISSNPFIWILYAFGGWAIIGFLFIIKTLIGALLGSIRKRSEARKIATELCPHGLAGGKTRLKSLSGNTVQLKCHECTEDEHRAREQEQLEMQRQQLAVKIKAAADELKTAEYTRLTKLRTHKIDFLLRLSPGEFEEIVGQMYSRFGYSVERTPMSNDFGRDLILQKDGNGSVPSF